MRKRRSSSRYNAAPEQEKKYIEKWGDSIDAAVELALLDLKLTKDQVTVTVLEQPTKGFFGIGSKLAKVRVEKIEQPKKTEKPVEVKTEKNTEKKSEPVKNIVEEKKENTDSSSAETKEKTKKKKNKAHKSVKEEKPVNSKTEEKKTLIVSEKPKDLVAVEEHPAKEFLEKTFKEMNLEVSVSVEVNKDSVYVDVEGKDTGTVIGKRGQTLDAIQYLTSLVVNKGENEYIRVIVDAEGYRAKREATLEKLALRLAEKVKKSGRSTRLEPMNPYERKVIHTTLQGVEGINTRSEGDEPYRRVVIEAKK